MGRKSNRERRPVEIARPEPRRETRIVLAVCGLLLLAVGLVFGQTLGHDFVNFDDHEYVYENPHVIARPDGRRHRLGLHDQSCRQLASADLALPHAGLPDSTGSNAGGHHLTNVLLHAATAILLFLVLRRMTGDLWPSAFVAAVFAVHPLRVESVAWVAERKDVLSGLFFMLTLAAYLGYVRRPFSLVRYLAVMASVRPGPDGQADAGDAALRAAAVGLLAAGTNGRSRDRWSPHDARSGCCTSWP